MVRPEQVGAGGTWPADGQQRVVGLIGHFNGLPEPYEMEHARFFVNEVAMGNADRIEHVILDAISRERLGRVGLGLHRGGAGEIGYRAAPVTHGKGVTTHAVKALWR